MQQQHRRTAPTMPDVQHRFPDIDLIGREALEQHPDIQSPGWVVLSALAAARLV